MTRFSISPFDEAIYDAAHEYINPVSGEKGVSALARRTGRNPTTLRKKVDPLIETHLINTDELRMIIRETRSYTILEALAAEFNHGIALLSEQVNGNNKGILNAILKAGIEGGEAYKAIDDALSDDVIMASEAVICAKEIDDQINALLTLRKQVMDSVVDPDHLPEGVRRITSTPKK